MHSRSVRGGSRSCRPQRGWLGGLGRGRRRGRRFLGTLKLAADFVGDLERNGTGVRFLLGYAKAGQKIDDGLGFDLELAGQFVNSDLGGITHTS
jgi:hypothetical protein